MELIHQGIDWVLHLEHHLDTLVKALGLWTYAVLFLVIFCETGLVVTPILPGDSLLFTLGTMAGAGHLELAALLVVLSAAAVLGDAVNYAVGHFVGPRVFTQEESRWFKKEYLERTHRFYERYGGKTIVLARFVPIVRTFAPFVAGVGHMSYPRFAIYNIAGGVAWVSACVLGGYFVGHIPFVQRNFSLVLLLIVVLSVCPAILEFLRERRRGDGGDASSASSPASPAASAVPPTP